MPPLFVIFASQSGGKPQYLGNPLQALLYAAYPGCVLLNKAVGGSSILSWQQGTTNYNAALNDVRQLRSTHTPACIISVIGETDAKSKTQTAATFKALFWDALKDFRDDIGLPYLPVVYVQLGPKPEPVNGRDLYPSWETIRVAQMGLTVGHSAYQMVEGCGGYDDSRPFCHRTAAANEQQAALVFEAIKEKVR